MAGGQQITILQGNVGVQVNTNVSLALTGQQISALAGNVGREFVTEDTHLTVLAGNVNKTFTVPLRNKQSVP